MQADRVSRRRLFRLLLAGVLAPVVIGCGPRGHSPDDPKSCPTCHGIGGIGCAYCGGTYDDYKRMYRIGRGCRSCSNRGTILCPRCRGSGNRHR